MLYAILQRGDSSDQGTPGRLDIANGPQAWSCLTGELPARANAPDLSSIPPGTYTATWSITPKHKHGAYVLTSVPDRSSITLAAGRYFGDTAAGLKSDTKGSILVGAQIEDANDQLALTVSATTLANLAHFAQQKPISLRIKDAAAKNVTIAADITPPPPPPPNDATPPR